jgi:cyclic pyranopterin phosphate synthase
MSQLSHLNQNGESVMVEVSRKEESLRIAIAEAWIKMKSSTWKAINEGNAPKGEVLAVARVAGILAVKKTADVIPMCHPLQITGISIDFSITEKDDDFVKLLATVTAKNIGRTGIEMEALYGASVAVLTIYDMVKAIDKGMLIGGNRLIFKTGGRSGTYCPLPWTGVPRIASINLSAQKGERKIPVHEIQLIPEHGLEDDGHAGKWHRQVSLLAMESVDKMVKKGLSVKPGDFAENITTVGVDLIKLPIGTHFKLADARLEVTQIGKKCHNRCAIYEQAGDCVMPKEGIFAKVLIGGTIKTGDCLNII